MDVEASRPNPRRHSLGDPPAQRGVNLATEDTVALQRAAISRPSPEGRKLSAGGSPNISAPHPGPAAHKRRRASGGRRRSKGGRGGGSGDFSYSPYQPMVIATTSASVSPRPRRASAPVPPSSSSLLLHQQHTGGEGEGRQGQDTGGPTLDQCLVLPAGLALEIDGLLSASTAKSGAAPESEGSGGGGGGGAAPQTRSSSENSLGGGDGERDYSDPGAGRGDDRAIISSYHFETSSALALADADQEKAGESAEIEANEHDDYRTGEAIAVVDNTQDGSEDEAASALARRDAPQDWSFSGSGDGSSSRSSSGSRDGDGITGSVSNGGDDYDGVESDDSRKVDNGEDPVGTEGSETPQQDPPPPHQQPLAEGDRGTGEALSGIYVDAAESATDVTENSAAAAMEGAPAGIPGSNDDAENVVGAEAAVSSGLLDSAAAEAAADGSGSSTHGVEDVLQNPRAESELEAQEACSSAEACLPGGGGIDPELHQTVAVSAGGIGGPDPAARAVGGPGRGESSDGEGEMWSSPSESSQGGARSGGSGEEVDVDGGPGVGLTVSPAGAVLPPGAAAPIEILEEAAVDLEPPSERSPDCSPDEGCRGEEREGEEETSFPQAAAGEGGDRSEDLPPRIVAAVSTNPPAVDDKPDANVKAGGLSPLLLETGGPTSTVVATLAGRVGGGSSHGSATAEETAERDGLAGEAETPEIGATGSVVGGASEVAVDDGKDVPAPDERDGSGEEEEGRAPADGAAEASEMGATLVVNGEGDADLGEGQGRQVSGGEAGLREAAPGVGGGDARGGAANDSDGLADSGEREMDVPEASASLGVVESASSTRAVANNELSGAEAEEKVEPAADGSQEVEAAAEQGGTQKEGAGEGGGVEDGRAELLAAGTGGRGVDLTVSPRPQSTSQDAGPETKDEEEEDGDDDAVGLPRQGDTCHPSNIEHEAGAAETREEMCRPSSNNEEEPSVALEEKPTASFSSTCSEVVLHDTNQPLFEDQAGDHIPAGAGEGDSDNAAKAAAWIMSQDEGQQEVEEEEPLDWEALAREVEAEWVMEGSGDESDLSYPVCSPPMSPRAPADASESSMQNSFGDDSAAAEDQPPLEVAAGVLETSSECNTPHQQEQRQNDEREGEGAKTFGDTSRDACEVHDVAPPQATESHRLRQEKEDGAGVGGGGGGSGVSGGSGGDDGQAAASDFGPGCQQDSEKGNDDSDCGSPFPPTIKGQGSLPANDGRESILPAEDSLADGRTDDSRPAPVSTWSRKPQHASVSMPVSRFRHKREEAKEEDKAGREEERRASTHQATSGIGMDPMDDDDARSAPSEEGAPAPAPSNTALDRLAAPAGEEVDRGASSGSPAEPVAAAVTAPSTSAAAAAASVVVADPIPARVDAPQDSTTPIRDGSKRGAGSLVAAGPGREAGKGGGRGGCAAGSCGCVLM